jgi:alpha-ketoglutarate-dependent taurine dioxygenase
MDLEKEIKKSGYVIIEDVGLDDPDGALKAHLSTIARPIAYLDLPLVMDLRPRPGFQPASYAGIGEFDLHTDLTWHEKPPKYIAMFCITQESAGGGIPLLADGWQAIEALDEKDVHYLRTEPVTFPPPSHITYPALTGPIVTERDNGELFIRFRYDMLENPAPAVDNFNRAVNKHVIHLNVSPGSIYIFDNERMLHGRTELKAGMQSDRFFKRMYGDI